jgi:glycosyltransferase involved in cell wall biosynthesis
MSILFGHPTGNPNSYNAALAYLEAGLLECFCVTWMPSTAVIGALKRLRPFRPQVERLERRLFLPLSDAPKVQGRVKEVCRLLVRASGLSHYHADHASRWLMRTMARECHRSTVTAVHAYEDCSLWQFIEARRLGKACIYDMPTCYHSTWERTRVELYRTYSDWIPSQMAPALHALRLEQKKQEMTLADLTLVASRYVEASIREFDPHKDIARIPYGIDAEFWTPGPANQPEPLRFLYAGNVSVRKGMPLLIDAWSKAGLRDAELTLVGSWDLADDKRRSLPRGVRWLPPCSSQALRNRYRESHVFVFPSYSDGFGLALLEAMACGLPVIASEASIGPEIVTADCGFTFLPGDMDRLVELLRWFDHHRDQVSIMGRQARVLATGCTWDNYRSLLTAAVSKLT